MHYNAHLFGPGLPPAGVAAAFDANLSTHPASAQRMSHIDRMIKALPEDAVKAAPLAYDYAAIKASIKRRE
jgi:hypothetical protein